MNRLFFSPHLGAGDVQLSGGPEVDVIGEDVVEGLPEDVGDVVGRVHGAQGVLPRLRHRRHQRVHHLI